MIEPGNPMKSDQQCGVGAQCASDFPVSGSSPGILPDAGDLKFLEQWFKPGFESALAAAPLLEPLREYLGRPGKRVRAQLVQIGFDLARGVSGSSDSQSGDLNGVLGALSALVEVLHAGSLAIDDIQDGSLIRRGQPSLHAVIGQAAAINAANWLYFWPTELVRRQGLPAHLELEIYRLYHRTLIEAHSGQSMDLSFDMTRVPRERAEAISLATLGLKTGALMSMCCEMGAIAAGAGQGTRQRLARLGHDFGVLLQMFNDLAEFGPYAQPADAAPPPFIRPSWIWAVGARNLAAGEFDEFREWMAAGAPASRPQPVVAEARAEAHRRMEQWLETIEEAFGRTLALRQVKELAKRVAGTHVSTSN